MKYNIICIENTNVVVRYSSNVIPVVDDFVALADEKVFHVKCRMISSSSSVDYILLIGLVISLDKMYEIVTNR